MWELCWKAKPFCVAAATLYKLAVFFLKSLDSCFLLLVITRRTQIGPSSLTPAENNSDCLFSTWMSEITDLKCRQSSCITWLLAYHDHLGLANQAVCIKKIFGGSVH